MRKNASLVILLLTIGVIGITVAASGAAQFISIATGGTGGAYFPIGAGMADIFNKKLTGYNASDRKSTRLNSSHIQKSRMPSSA